MSKRNEAKPSATSSDEAAEAEAADGAVVEEACTECDVSPATAEVPAGSAPDLELLCFQMQHSKTGVPVRTKRAGLKTLPCVFIGSEAVTWLVGRLQVERSEAVETGVQLQRRGLFSSVADTTEFCDRAVLFRFAKHDVSNRFEPSAVTGTLHMEAHGFLGCPFCKRAIDAGNALAAEVADDNVFTFVGREMENRVAFNDFLKVKRRELAERSSSATFHSTSPIVFVKYEGVEHYVGGLDDMLVFLNGVKALAKSKTLEHFKPQNPVVTFLRGIPGIARNLKATLPF
eukprot:TRINITY_DN5608_c1_g1_i1.p1 TRINITY_DN5608_c1_g1~~TRINITY_DN5608_c1_g1_i1.p1  ORF type:complete len:287 (+),score=78.15 TRINITY_DN5608_c1_g1_i1:367-1227(+)